MNSQDIKKFKMRLFKLYVKSRNFFVNNFFVNILCIKQNDTFFYLENNYLFLKYFFLLIPFYFLKLIANRFNYELIYRVDGIYGITNIKETHIIPFITCCNMVNNQCSLNITNQIRMYNTSIPISFFINNMQINDFDRMQLVYFIKSVKTEKEINLNAIDKNKFLIYELFEK